jgi:serine protease AprX
MHSGLFALGVAAGLSLVARAVAQDDGSGPIVPGNPKVALHYGTFDPTLGTLPIPPLLQAGADTRLWIVQFHAAPTDRDRAPLLALGAKVHGYLPHTCHVVRMDASVAAAVNALPAVRWVGAYEPAYRLQPELLRALAGGEKMPKARYNLVVADKRTQKGALAAKIEAFGGTVVDRQEKGLLLIAELDGAQLAAAARCDEVLWIDRWTEPGTDMNNARIQGGANAIETAAGYTGAGIRGHVYEGVEATHPDFATALVNVRSGGQQQRHGHCTAGIVFGDGTSSASARGMAPNAVGFYTNYTTVTAGFSRNAVIDEVVNTHNCMFTTASWGAAQTTAYTADSADADDIVFDHRIPWTNSMSNLGNQSVRPQAWAKNVISVGAVQHFNNSTAADDSWAAGNASIGPAADGRMKPDLCAYYDNVWTADLSLGLANNDPTAPGTTGGYNNVADPGGQSTTGFGGTSAATPIVAGHNALAIQMYTDHLFSNAPRVIGGSRFENRPFAQTLKALMIASANQYTMTASDNRREHVGWGFPSLSNLYDRRNKISVLPETVSITQGATHSYEYNVMAGETALNICMTYLDPAGNPAAALDRVNDLTLRVIAPNGTSYWGNVGLKGASQTRFSATGGAADTIDTVECVMLQNPQAGTWTVEITAPTLTQDANLATASTDATYALVVNGGIRLYGSGCARYIPDNSRTSATGNYYPFGGYAPSTVPTIFTGGNFGVSGGAVYFDATVGSPMYVTGMEINTTAAAGTDLVLDVYRTAAGVSYAGNEANAAAWVPMTAGKGTSAGPNAPTLIEFATPFFLSPGSFGIAIDAGNFAHSYTNGTGANQSYGNATLSLSLGSATSVPFSGTPFTPRVANVTLQYRVGAAQGTNLRYQTIVRGEELGVAGAIRSLSFSAQDTMRHWNRQLTIKMSHVPPGHTLAATFASNLPAPTTVLDAFNHSFRTIADNWVDIGLQTPFAYDGVSDLVVEVTAIGNWQTTPGQFHDSNEPRVYATNWITAPATGTVDANQALRMRVGYDCATATNLGASCGPLENAYFGSAQRGTSFLFLSSGAPANGVMVLALGLTNGFPLPLSLTPLGWTNCFGFNDAVSTPTVLASAAGVGNYTLPIPNNVALDGTVIYGQWIGLDPSEPGSLTFSGQTRMLVGTAP